MVSTRFWFHCSVRDCCSQSRAVWRLVTAPAAPAAPSAFRPYSAWDQMVWWPLWHHRQPFFPGVAGAPVAGDSTVLDPDYQPEVVDTFDFTIQRQISRKVSFEVGYMGKIASHIFEQVDIDAVPYMMTLGGQTFADAYKNMYLAICGPTLGPTCK